jgi:hypothetical protein
MNPVPIPLPAFPIATSKIEILERFQSKALRMKVDASWHVPNAVIRTKKTNSMV